MPHNHTNCTVAVERDLSLLFGIYNNDTLSLSTWIIQLLVKIMDAGLSD